MKKALALLLAISMIFIFTACSGGASDEDPDDDSQAIEEMEDEDSLAPDRDLAEGSYEDIGDGSFYISSGSVSTKDGGEVVLNPDMSSDPYVYLDYEVSGLDGNAQTFIYIDGIEMDDMQAEEEMRSVGLGEDELWALTEGEHKVEAVQYADNDSDGKMTFYRSAAYTVKAAEQDKSKVAEI